MTEYKVDVIEVVGHTDENPVESRLSNLDSDLLLVLRNEAEIGSAVSADNAGLGLARAVSVVRVLRQNKELSKYKILPLSGGELINTDETLATSGAGGDAPERRRIEIRLRKANPQTVAAARVVPSEMQVPEPPPRPTVGSAQVQPPQVRRPTKGSGLKILTPRF